jgi:hypothetical protein
MSTKSEPSQKRPEAPLGGELLGTGLLLICALLAPLALDEASGVVPKVNLALGVLAVVVAYVLPVYAKELLFVSLLGLSVLSFASIPERTQLVLGRNLAFGPAALFLFSYSFLSPQAKAEGPWLTGRLWAIPLALVLLTIFLLWIAGFSSTSGERSLFVLGIVGITGIVQINGLTQIARGFRNATVVPWGRVLSRLLAPALLVGFTVALALLARPR